MRKEDKITILHDYEEAELMEEMDPWLASVDTSESPPAVFGSSSASSSMISTGNESIAAPLEHVVSLTFTINFWMQPKTILHCFELLHAIDALRFFF